MILDQMDQLVQTVHQLTHHRSVHLDYEVLQVSVDLQGNQVITLAIPNFAIPMMKSLSNPNPNHSEKISSDKATQGQG